MGWSVRKFAVVAVVVCAAGCAGSPRYEWPAKAGEGHPRCLPSSSTSRNADFEGSDPPADRLDVISYRLCEARANGDLTSAQYSELLQRALTSRDHLVLDGVAKLVGERRAKQEAVVASERELESLEDEVRREGRAFVEIVVRRGWSSLAPDLCAESLALLGEACPTLPPTTAKPAVLSDARKDADWTTFVRQISELAPKVRSKREERNRLRAEVQVYDGVLTRLLQSGAAP